MLIIALVLISVLLLAAFALCIYCYRFCFYSQNRTPMDPYGPHHGRQYLAVKDQLYAATRKMEEAPFEAVSIKSFDGLSLNGRYYHHQDGAPVMLLFHGYRSMSLRDGAGGYAIGEKFSLNVLAVDQRAHEKSDGHTISFGILERRDCLSWAQYVNDRFGTDTPIILSGLSMGAATVLMATDQPLPKNVVAVMADCPYSSPRAIIRLIGSERVIPIGISYPFIRLSARLFGHFDLQESGALEAASRSDLPILLLHGEDDHFVPCDMSRQICAAAQDHCRLVTFPGAGHGLSYVVDPEKYERSCYEFLSGIPQLRTHFHHCNFAQKQSSSDTDI